jgi:hypothetical protein
MTNTSPNGDRNVEHKLSFEEGLCEYAKQKICKFISVNLYVETMNVTPASHLKSSGLIFAQRRATLNEGIHGFTQSL